MYSIIHATMSTLLFVKFFAIMMSYKALLINLKSKHIIHNIYYKLMFLRRKSLCKQVNILNTIYFHSDMNLCSDKINLKKTIKINQFYLSEILHFSSLMFAFTNGVVLQTGNTEGQSNNAIFQLYTFDGSLKHKRFFQKDVTNGYLFYGPMMQHLHLP